MTPLKLELIGFTGIMDGFGRDELCIDLTTIPESAVLVAFRGPNGHGKTTVLDNLQPYRVMPSRSSTFGPGGFSYYDHICKSVAEKKLHWALGKRRFLTHLRFKVMSKSQTDAYLFEWCDELADWAPAKLPDGTVSDGKCDTYDRCVNFLLGPPERFFTSQFSSQGRRSITKYEAGEIKSILASILFLEQYSDLASNANLVTKHLSQHLETLQDELSLSRSATTAIEATSERLHDVDLAINSLATAEATELLNVDQAKQNLTTLEVKRDSQAKDAQEIKFLEAQIEAVQVALKLDRQRIAAAGDKVSTAIAAEITKLASQDVAAAAAIKKGEGERERFQKILAEKPGIVGAQEELPKKQTELAHINDSIAQYNEALATAGQLRLKHSDLIRRQATLKTQGQACRTVIEQLGQTASLIESVPCVGGSFQKSCTLLSGANLAASERPEKLAAREKLLEDYRAVTAQVAEVDAKLTEVAKIEDAVKQLNAQRDRTSATISQLALFSAKIDLVRESEQRLPLVIDDIDKNLTSRREIAEALKTHENTHAENIRSVGDALESTREQAGKQVSVLQERIDKLEKPVSDASIAAARVQVQQATQLLEQVRAKGKALSNEKVSLLAAIEVHKHTLATAKSTVLEASGIQDEIAKWKRIEKGMGNNGIIALSIDDAGPEISKICNDLLRDSYGTRYSVRIDTQKETRAGSFKETFEINVFDSIRGKRKPLAMMSGGENVWINDCLARAIALYASHSSPIQYETLFTDEADGALDPSNKRLFVQMKRAVLRCGGYRREYFVSHTPEVIAMADHVIDFTTL